MAEDPLSDSEACRVPLLSMPSSVTAQLGENSRERRVCQTLNLAASAFAAGEHTQPGGSVHRETLTGEPPKIHTTHKNTHIRKKKLACRRMNSVGGGGLEAGSSFFFLPFFLPSSPGRFKTVRFSSGEVNSIRSTHLLTSAPFYPKHRKSSGLSA